MKTKGTIFTMIVALIEKVYSFLWGDLIHIPLPGGAQFSLGSTGGDRNLFHCKDKTFTNQNVSGHDKGADR